VRYGDSLDKVHSVKMECLQKALVIGNYMSEYASYSANKGIPRTLTEQNRIAKTMVEGLMGSITNAPARPQLDGDADSDNEEEHQPDDDSVNTILSRLSTREMRDKVQLALAQIIDIVLLEKQIQKYTVQYGRVISELGGSMPSHLTQRLPDHGADSEHELGSGWGEAFRSFMKNLAGLSRRTMGADGHQALQLPEHALASCVDQLAADLRVSHNESMEEQATTLAAVNAEMRDRLYLVERYTRHIESIREAEKKESIRKVKTEVIDNCYGLIFDARNAALRVKALEEKTDNLEYSLRSTIKQEYDDELVSLKSSLETTKANFKEYRLNLFQQMLSNMRDIRKEAILKFQANELVPDETAEKTRQAISLEDQITNLNKEVSDKSRAIVKLKTMASLKRLSARFENEELKAQQKRREDDERSLMEKQADFDERENALRLQLANTQDALSAMEVELMEAREKLSISNKLRKELVKWKLLKSEELETLQAKVSKYDKWDIMEIDKVLSERERDAGELNRLKKLEQHGNKKAAMIEAKAQKEVEKLSRALQEEKAVKTEAFKKVQMLRDEMQQQGGGDKASVDGQQWMDRYLACCEQLEVTARENEVMRQAFKEMGREPPFAASDSGLGGQRLDASGPSQSVRPATGLNAIGGRRHGIEDDHRSRPSRLLSHGRPPQSPPGMAPLRTVPNMGGQQQSARWTSGEAARLTQDRSRDMALSGSSVNTRLPPATAPSGLGRRVQNGRRPKK